jgi:integrase
MPTWEQGQTPVKLTEKRVAALTPDPDGKRDAFAWDDAIPGFGVRAKPSGAKGFVLWYRTRAGTKRLYTIGSAAAFRVERAREEARELLVQIKKGADPVEERKKARDAKTIGELCDRYLREHVKEHNKPSTAAEVERIIETRIKPELGRIPIAELSRARVKQWHQSMSSTPYEANRALAYCSKMLSLAAAEWELRPDSPCKGIKKFPEAKRQRFLDGRELERLGKALAGADQGQLELPAVTLAIRLLALTGCRLSEILGLTWDSVDLGKGTLCLSDAKAGPRIVPLAAPAVAALSGSVRDDASPIFRVADGKLLSVSMLEKAWRRLCKLAGLENARLHDLRHTVGTYAGSAGLNAFMVRDLLGHKTLAMTNRYVERDADPLRAAANAVSGRIAAAMAGEKGAEVVELTEATAKRRI